MSKIVVILTKVSKGEIMKALTILATFALTTSSVMALDTAMDVKGRFDYIHSETENTPGSKTSSGILTTSYLRLITLSKVNETTSLKLALDFQPTSTVDNGLSNTVDTATLTKTVNAFSFIIGKQAVLTGGRENDYSGRDIYLYSKFVDSVTKNLTGLSVAYTFAGHDLYLQYLQQTDSTKNPLVDKKVVGAAYYGSFLDKMIMPIISYHKLGTNRPGAYDIQTAVGLRFNVQNFIVEADYLMLEQEKTATGDKELTSIVGHVRYVYGGFQPFVKFIKDDGKKGYAGIISGADKSERTSFEVGLEYVPNKDEDMRYHVVYDNMKSEQKSPAPTSEVKEQKLFAGVAFNFNILK